jgi:hypothetical protein
MNKRNILIVFGALLLALGWLLRDMEGFEHFGGPESRPGSGPLKIVLYHPYRTHGALPVIIGAGTLAAGLVAKRK